MKDTEVSQVIEDRNHLYILLLESRVPARLRPFLEVRERIHEILSFRQRAAQHKAWFQRLREKAHIVYYPIEVGEPK